MVDHQMTTPVPDPMEAERAAYEEACGNYYDAQQTHFEARIAWGTDYAKEYYPVGDVPVPPCDGSYTEPWESTEAVHGAATRDENYTLSEHCDEMGIHGDARLDYQQSLHERHPLGLPDTLAGLL